MLRLNSQWGETRGSLLQRSIYAEAPRLRERFLALSLIAGGQSVCQVAPQVGRTRQAVSDWVRRFNDGGPEGLGLDTHSPSRPRLSDKELATLRQVVAKPPRDSGLKVGRWTSKGVAAYIRKQFGQKVHPETARRYVHRLGFVLKRPRKKLRKAKKAAQKAFASALQTLEETRWGHSVTVWIDEGHIWQDALLRWMWCLKGQEAEVESTSPGKKKLSFYVAVIRPLGRVLTLPVKSFCQENTARFLAKIRAALPGYRLDAVWDGASHHQGALVEQTLQRQKIHGHPLPAYSPNMNAAEPWIRWIKEILSYNLCWQELKQLIRSFNGTVASMAYRTEEILSRCVPELLGFKCV
jgi:transposase